LFDVPVKGQHRKDKAKNLKLEYNVPTDLVGTIITTVNMSPKEGD